MIEKVVVFVFGCDVCGEGGEYTALTKAEAVKMFRADGGRVNPDHDKNEHVTCPDCVYSQRVTVAEGRS